MGNGQQIQKVAFLFGAGAEGKYNYDIATGKDYFASTVFPKVFLSGFDNGLRSFLGNRRQFFSNRSQNQSNTNCMYYTYTSHCLVSKRFLLKKLIISRLNENRDLLFQNTEAKKYVTAILTNEELKKLFGNAVKKKGTIDKSKITKMKEEIQTVFINENPKKSDAPTIFSKIPWLLPCDQDGESININTNVGIAGELDRYFHTISNPCTYGKADFSCIFNYYWACYFTILKDVLRHIPTQKRGYIEEVEGIKVFKKRRKHEEQQLNYEGILQNLQRLTEFLYDEDLCLCQPDSYYDWIARELRIKTTELTCVGVATTNYYRFCETVYRDPIYLNGSLKLFEFPETLEVKDGGDKKTDLSGEKLFFPFIFGQSMVKPIVHSKQTEEFHRFKEMLKEASVLVVLGYGINEDDNHINAFLHEFLEEDGKRLICVNKTGEVDSIIKKLRFTEEGSGKDNVKDRIAAVSFSGDNNKTVKEIFKLIRSKKTSQEKFDIAVAASNIANGKGELT